MGGTPHRVLISQTKKIKNPHIGKSRAIGTKLHHAPEVPYDPPNRIDMRKKLQELEAEIEMMKRARK